LNTERADDWRPFGSSEALPALEHGACGEHAGQSAIRIELPDTEIVVNRLLPVSRLT